MSRYSVGTLHRRALRRVDRRAVPIRLAMRRGMPREAIALSLEFALLREAVRLANDLAR